jgi:UDP-glucose 4-epimerase
MPTFPTDNASPPRTILVTGGAGFIGSHTCVELLQNGHDVVVVDDFSNSSRGALDRIETVAGRALSGRYGMDTRDYAALSAVLDIHPVDAVIHFAAKKAVGESVGLPLEYYDINVGSTLQVLKAMASHGVTDLVFSSSCSIYGAGDKSRFTEDDDAAPTNPYARSKWMCEQILEDACVRFPELHIIALRYFNPTGAHPSGMLGEVPRGVPNNIMPFLTQVAVGRLDRLQIFGGDYATADGTCVRDYIHVVDVADGHRVALDHLRDEPGLQRFNLGSGVGTTVLQLVEEFQRACGAQLPITIGPRRDGDVETLVADASRVAAEWGWHTTRDVSQMCRDAWAFQRDNPDGYHDNVLAIQREPGETTHPLKLVGSASSVINSLNRQR